MNGIPLFKSGNVNLSHSYIYCGRAFLTLLYVKGDSVAFLKRLETGSIDPSMVNKYIGTIFLFNKTVTFTVIKPLYSSTCHSDTLLSKNSRSSKLRVATFTNGSSLQN